jgi:hypothetical protein
MHATGKPGPPGRARFRFHLRLRGIVRPALLALAATATVWAIVTPAVSQARVGNLRQCRDLEVTGVLVSRIRANFRCADARRALRGLLRGGIASLPVRRAGRRAWGCRKRGTTRICTKRTRSGAPMRRITFTARAKRDPPPKPAAPQECIDGWNADEANAAQYGVHFYADHGIRSGWVFLVDVRCAVVFVVPVSDPEYGTDGEVGVPGGGWELMDRAFSDPYAIQRQAADNANVALDPAGKLTAL